MIVEPFELEVAHFALHFPRALSATSRSVSPHLGTEGYGQPEKALSDGGSAFYSWKGVGRFTDLLNDLEIDQIIAENPETNGKLEALNANIQKELFNQEMFFDLGETQRRLHAWIDF